MISKGLPWSYSPQDILMRHAGQIQRARQPTLEAEAEESEMKEIATEVAAGMVGPTPGLKTPVPNTPGMVAPKTPNVGSMAPATPGPTSPSGETGSMALKRPLETSEESEPKRLDDTSSPRKTHEKREPEVDVEELESEQRERGHDEPMRTLEASPRGSPSSRLYPPTYAGVNAVNVEIHGDEEIDLELIPNEVEEDFFAYGGEEDEDPPEVTEERLAELDAQAREKEIQRMIEMPAMIESDEEEVTRSEGCIISTKEVYTCVETSPRDGRMVSSCDIGGTAVQKLHRPRTNVRSHVDDAGTQTFDSLDCERLSDIKDAFLMAPQPTDEVAFVRVNDRIFRLLRCLPGQRTAASQWFQLFARTCLQFGMVQDMMQPTLMMLAKELYVTVHVDDVFMVGTEEKLLEFVAYLKKEMDWNVEEKGPFQAGDKFHYLKRQFDWWRKSCTIRCDHKQYDSLEKDVTNLHARFYRKTPMSNDFGKKDESPELDGSDITKFRSIVGKLMYISGERPDAQHAIQCLARHMAKPTQMAMKNAEHVVSYLFGAAGYGVMMDSRKRGQSVMDVREEEEAIEHSQHLLEVITDADYAGNKNDRKSTSSFQIFMDGNLIESKVRAQKSIALSSGESEFVAMVAGSSEGLLVRHLWNKMTGVQCTMKVRSDSSAARRQGIGRVRNLDSSLLWIQQKEKEKVLTVAPIPTDLNCADIGTKNLAKKRLLGLLFMLKMVNMVNDRVGEEEFEDLERNYPVKSSQRQIGNKKALRVCLLLLLANLEKASGATMESYTEDSHFGWSWTVFCVCAFFGVLSIFAWLRDFIFVFVKGGITHLLDFKKVTIQNDESTVRVVLEKKVDMQAEHVKQGMYIEELEEKISMLKEQAEEHFQMFQLETRHAQKLMRQMANLKKAPTGQVIHFAPGCPHYAKASAIELCKKCMVEGGRDRISRAVKHMRIQPRISAICRYRLETPFWRKDRASI